MYGKRGENDGPFFRFEDGRHVKRDRFVTTVNTALVTLGINPLHYAGHSFRITTAANYGLLDYPIKTLGQWESLAYTLYICTPKEILCAVYRLLAGIHTH